jgi:hypothetical protein
LTGYINYSYERRLLWRTGRSDRFRIPSRLRSGEPP